MADSHNYHTDVNVPDGDVLIHAGDFTLVGSLNEVVEFNDWLGSLPHKYKIVIAGNHDRCLGQNDTLGIKMLTNAIYLQHSSVTLEGVKFWGSPWTPSFHGMREGLTFYTNSDGEAKNIWRGMPKNADVIITHGPPKGILDTVRNDFNGAYEEHNCGDGMLMSKIIKFKPKYHVFGHIHEEGGKTFEAPYGTKFMNCSVVNARYDVVNKPMVFEI